jgi:hypothetical protein
VDPVAILENTNSAHVTQSENGMFKLLALAASVIVLNDDGDFQLVLYPGVSGMESQTQRNVD